MEAIAKIKYKGNVFYIFLVILKNINAIQLCLLISYKMKPESATKKQVTPFHLTITSLWVSQKHTTKQYIV